jgi:hypothetical protein
MVNFQTCIVLIRGALLKLRQEIEQWFQVNFFVCIVLITVSSQFLYEEEEMNNSFE